MGPLALLAALMAAPLLAEPSVSIEARAFHPGEAVLVAVSSHPGRPPRGTFRGERIPFFAASGGTWLSLIGLDLDVATGTARLELILVGEGGRPHLWGSAVPIEPKDFPRQELEVEDKFVRLSAQDEARAEREAALLGRLFARVGRKRLFHGRFRAPIMGAESARFGERRVFNGVPKSPHSGADLRAKAGVPVRAAAGGRVVLAQDLFYAGKTVVLDHGWGVHSSYSHLSAMEAAEGDIVAKGAILGLVGATGRVTGPHLHWGVKVGGARVDPFSLLYLDLDRSLR